MSSLLRHQKFAFILLAVLTVVAIALILTSSVAHIDLLHLYTAGGGAHPNGGGCGISSC